MVLIFLLRRCVSSAPIWPTPLLTFINSPIDSDANLLMLINPKMEPTKLACVLNANIPSTDITLQSYCTCLRSIFWRGSRLVVPGSFSTNSNSIQWSPHSWNHSYCTAHMERRILFCGGSVGQLIERCCWRRLVSAHFVGAFLKCQFASMTRWILLNVVDQLCLDKLYLRLYGNYYWRQFLILCWWYYPSQVLWHPNSYPFIEAVLSAHRSTPNRWFYSFFWCANSFDQHYHIVYIYASDINGAFSQWFLEMLLILQLLLVVLSILLAHASTVTGFGEITVPADTSWVPTLVNLFESHATNL